MRVSISPGNSKTGRIPSVSLPPIVTCPPGVPCAAKCYAAKLCRLRPSVREAYARNLECLQDNPESYFSQVTAAARLARYFRWHISGDIPGPAYLDGMVRTAEKCPGTEFLAFTKRHELVNEYRRRRELPPNLHIVFSEWPGLHLDNPYQIPTAAVVLRGQEPRPEWLDCPGNCAACLRCWNLYPGQTVYFNEH